MNNNSEQADFYKIYENNVMVKYLTLYNNDDLNHYIESNKVIPNNLEGVEVLIGFLVNKQTGAFSRLCFYSEISIGQIEDETKADGTINFDNPYETELNETNKPENAIDNLSL
jgi:hypothetical protein